MKSEQNKDALATMTTHSFGGPWTLIKLDLLGRYLTFFNTALQGQPRPASPFDRIYIDAFAGTGQCEIKLTDGTRSTINGSAKIALSADVDRTYVSQIERGIGNPSLLVLCKFATILDADAPELFDQARGK